MEDPIEILWTALVVLRGGSPESERLDEHYGLHTEDDEMNFVANSIEDAISLLEGD